MIKLSVNETKWSSLLAWTRALILYILIWIFDFGPVKLPGLSRNGPQVWKRVWKITYFSLKEGLDLKNRAVHPTMNSQEHPRGLALSSNDRVFYLSPLTYFAHTHILRTRWRCQREICTKKNTRLIFHLGHSFVSPNNKPSNAFYKIVRFACKRFLFSPPFFPPYYLFICSCSNFLTITEAEMLTFS